MSIKLEHSEQRKKLKCSRHFKLVIIVCFCVMMTVTNQLEAEAALTSLPGYFMISQ